MKEWVREQSYDNKAIRVKAPSDCGVHSFHCECLMCASYETKKQFQLLKQQQDNINNTITARQKKKYPDSHLQRVLRGLTIPSNKIVKRGVQIFVPQICFFQEGETSSFYCTKDLEDYHLLRVKKDKITPTFLQKMLYQRRRGYRERFRRLHGELSRQSAVNGRKRSFVNSKKKSGKQDSLSAAVIRYTDGCETLLSEGELLVILQRRRTDPFWKRVAFIRNYIPSWQEPGESIKVDFNIQKPLYPALWERAGSLMQTYSSRVLPNSPSFIADCDELSFCNSLREQSKIAFATYCFYKVAAFIGEFADERIDFAQTRWLVNEVGQCYLLEVRRLEISPMLKYSFTNEIYQQMVQQNEERKYHRKELQVTQATISVSSAIQDIMIGEYQNLKKRYGVTVQPKEDVNQKLNNQFFSYLYPELPDNLSELVKIDIPLTTFRKKFLGIKQEHKPLFRPFNSRFVRELHKLTPSRTIGLNRSLREEGSLTGRSAVYQSRKVSIFSNTIAL